MDYQDLSFFKNKLEEMEQNLIQEIAENASKYYSEKSAEELENISNSMSNEIFLLEQQKRQDMLKQVQFALMRIKNGVYGVCVKTGKLINIKRLKANPTSLCDII